MYLSKIIITNFKTIFGSLEIEFSKKMTLLTGENGSGKSNILDAILFTLGAHDERQEGTAIELISTDFNANRRLADFCEVSLFFQNGNGPNDVISITRQLRVPKSGRIYSIYKLNGKTSSLSEIHDYLGRFGIEPYGFNMVKQGEISTRINESPESRKKLIEKVAGISQYDPKILEAEAKINNAKNTIRHVELLIQDTKKRLTSLEKSKVKTIKFRELKNKINYQKALKLINVVNKLDSKISGYENELKNKAVIITDYKRQIQEINEKLQEFKELINEELKNRNLLENEKMQMTGASKVQIKNLSEIDKQIFVLKEKVNDIKKKIEIIQTKSIKDLSKEAKKLKNRYATAIEEDKENKKVSRDLQAEILSLQDELPRLEREYKTLIIRRDRVINQIEDLENKRNELDQQRAEWNTKKEFLEQQRLEYIQRLETIEESIRKIDNGLRTLQSRKNRIDKEKQKAEDFHFQSREHISALLPQVQQIEFQLNELKSKYNTFEVGLKESKPRYSPTVSKILELRDKNQIPGIIGTVLELIIEIDRNYALAIEIAGGNKLQSIVLKSSDTMGEIIQYVKDNEFGQISLYPLDMIRSNIEKSTPKDKNVIGKVISLIKFDPQYYNIFSAIFGDTLLVKNIETAKKYQKYGCVTVDGDLISPDGEIFAIGRFDSKFLLINEFYRRKMQELNITIANTEERYKKLNSQINSLINKRDKNDKKRLELIEQIAKIDGRIIELNKSRKEIEPELDELKPKFRKIDDDLKDAITNFENLDIELGQIIEKIKNLNLKKDEIQVLLDNTEYGNVENLIKEKEEQVAALHRKILAFDRDRSHYTNRINQINSQISLFNNQIIELQNQIKEKELEKKELVDKRNRLAAEVNKKKQKFNEIDSKILEINKRLDKIQKDRSNLVQKKEEISLNIEKVNSEINEINKLKSTIEERRRNLKTQIESLGIKIEKVKEIDISNVDKEIEKLETELSMLGPVDPTAPEKYDEETKRIKNLTVKYVTCQKELDAASEMYNELYKQKSRRFIDVLQKLNVNLKEIFGKIHPNGSIELISTNPESPLEGGVDIKVNMGAGVVSSTKSLSGGQNSVVAASIIFAIQKLYKRSVWYFLDEIDAHLDDPHCEALGRLLHQLSSESQYIITTPKLSYLREYAQRIYILWKNKGFTKMSCQKREDYN
ncbi:MAG: AAA family ATPase [Candidatus Helarchaeota archaeon]